MASKSLPNPLYGPFKAKEVRALLEGVPVLDTTSELLELLSFLDYLAMESLVKQAMRQTDCKTLGIIAYKSCLS